MSLTAAKARNHRQVYNIVYGIYLIGLVFKIDLGPGA